MVAKNPYHVEWLNWNEWHLPNDKDFECVVRTEKSVKLLTIWKVKVTHQPTQVEVV